jgi:hypothetical protein
MLRDRAHVVEFFQTDHIMKASRNYFLLVARGEHEWYGATS